jgi:TonB-linked SusC/RagA family outer membrane protein
LGGGAVALPGSSSLTESQLASSYSRLNYNFDDRFLLTFNARYDGSSNFSKNNKWAFFPSGALAWNMHNEKFMQSVNAISSFKWRVSYGLTGNQAINPYQTLAGFSSVLSVIGNVPVNAVRPTSIANDDLKWETTAQQNLGIDVGLLKNRITFTADYYKSITSDLLFSVPLPQYSGYSNQLRNIGKIENKGLEFTLGTKNMTGAFNWSTDLNISFNRNKVLELPNGNDILYANAPGHMIGIGQTSQILRVGQPIGTFFGWIYNGVYQTGDTFNTGGGFEQVAGGEKFKDISGKKDSNGLPLFEPDGVINNDDRQIIGNPNPKFIYGINNDFSFKNLDLNVFFQGSEGNDMLSYTLLELETISGRNNATTEALNRWTPTNTNTNIPKASSTRSQRTSSRFIFDGSYIRLKNISLGYTLPKSTLSTLKIQSLRFYVSAQNIFTSTKYRGYDPEVNYRNSNLNAGVDYASYPNAKSVTAGINVGF